MEELDEEKTPIELAKDYWRTVKKIKSEPNGMSESEIAEFIRLNETELEKF